MVLGEVIKPIAEVAPGRRQRRWLSGYVQKSLAPMLAFTAAFIVGVGLLGQIIPSPAIPSNVVFIGPKHDYYQAHRDDYNAIFFGSSRVFNQIVPDIFDAAASLNKTSAGQSNSVNSYNFGVPAMRAIDSLVLLEEVLSDPPENLQWVFFESVLDRGYEPIENARTYRSMYWHTWKNTRLAADYIWASEASFPSKLLFTFSHVLPALYRQLNVGRLFNQVLPSEFSAKHQSTVAEFTKDEGYFALTDEDSPRRQAFLANEAAYLEKVERLKAIARNEQNLPRAVTLQGSQQKSGAMLPKNKRQLLQRVTRIVRAAGAEPIFIEPPSLEQDSDFKIAERLGDIETLLAYKDPEKFPQFYAFDQRYDADHLSEAASQAFSKTLGEDFRRVILKGRNVALKGS
ncbi:MAG: hypothetical protein AAFR58_16895 [Cyanobacteria bacterium J06627_28]